MLATGASLQTQVDTLEVNLDATGEHLHDHIDTVSGDLLATGASIQTQVDTLEVNLDATGEHLHDHIDTVSGDLISVSGQTFSSS